MQGWLLNSRTIRRRLRWKHCYTCFGRYCSLKGCRERGRAKSTSDFRPIAVVRLLYKTFACLVLGRIEATLDAGQPAEQHGFRADRRRNLWEALDEHGVSDHMFRVLQCMYHGQTGRSGDNTIDRDWLCIGGGVRQGCVLRPRLFSCVLEVALGCWRRIGGNAGVDFQDGIDILLFAKTFQETKFLLGELVTCLAKLGYTSTWGKQKYLQFNDKVRTKCFFEMDKLLKSLAVALHINGWDACFAQQVLAITPQIWHITIKLRRKRFTHKDLFGQQECYYARLFQIS